MLKAQKDIYSDELNTRIDALLDAERDNAEARQAIDEERAASVEKAATMTAHTLENVREELTAKKYNRHLEALELATSRHNLTADCLNYTRDRLEPCREHATTERKKASKRFKTLGISLESQRAWGLDNKAAQIQFDHKLLEVASVKAADGEVERAEKLARDLSSELKKTNPAIEAAESALSQLAAAILK
jgi:hypothetical protein